MSPFEIAVVFVKSRITQQYVKGLFRKLEREKCDKRELRGEAGNGIYVYFVGTDNVKPRRKLRAALLIMCVFILPSLLQFEATFFLLFINNIVLKTLKLKLRIFGLQSYPLLSFDSDLS